MVIKRSGFETDGWTLNVSRGGVRVILEDSVGSGDEYEIAIGDSDFRRGRIAWVREEADGQIVGIQFLDVEGSVPPPAVSGDGE